MTDGQLGRLGDTGPLSGMWFFLSLRRRPRVAALIGEFPGGRLRFGELQSHIPGIYSGCSP